MAASCTWGPSTARASTCASCRTRFPRTRPDKVAIVIADAGAMVTDLTDTVLVCVYYRVAGDHSARVISTVREFQRTLHAGSGVREVEVLLRCDLPSAEPAPDDHAPHVSPLAAPPSGADATVMETYRLALPT